MLYSNTGGCQVYGNDIPLQNLTSGLVGYGNVKAASDNGSQLPKIASGRLSELLRSTMD